LIQANPYRTRLPEIVAAICLSIVTLTLALASLQKPALRADAAQHLVVLLGFMLGSAWLWRRQDRRWEPAARGTLVFAILFFLYGSLGHVAFEAIPWNADPWLSRLDIRFGWGRAPALEAQALTRHLWSVELLSAYYAAFIPYLYLSIFLGLLGRPPLERERFLLAFALLYSLSFMGYLFVPARGPIVELAGRFAGPIQGGFFHGLVRSGIELAGGPHGAFPSLHLGASMLACTFDLRHRNTLRGLIYVPLVGMIALATVALRYHYAIDLLAGAALALGSLALAVRLVPASAGPRA
jgi:hypothetical protein